MCRERIEENEEGGRGAIPKWQARRRKHFEKLENARGALNDGKCVHSIQYYEGPAENQLPLLLEGHDLGGAVDDSNYEVIQVSFRIDADSTLLRYKRWHRGQRRRVLQALGR